MRKLTSLVILGILMMGMLWAEVPESTWKALLNSNVIITKNDDSKVRGKLTYIDTGTVSVINKNGKVVTVAKKDVADARASTGSQGMATAGEVTVGWAPAATVMGFVSAGVAMALGVGVIASNGDEEVPVILGGVDLAFCAIMFPIVAIGEASALKGGVTGVPGLRTTAWVSYGLTMGLGLIEIGLGFAEILVPSGAIASTVALGVIALTSIAMDGIFAVREARRKMHSAATNAPADAPYLTAILPTFNLVPVNAGTERELQVGLMCHLLL